MKPNIKIKPCWVALEKINVIAVGQLGNHVKIRLTRRDNGCHNFPKENGTKNGKQQVKTIKCDFCLKIFLSNGNFLRHLIIHTKEKPYKCELCDKTFNLNANLKSHKRVHTREKCYKCKFCSKEFFSKGGVQDHERYHTGERPYSCKFCNMFFPTYSMRNYHHQMHTDKIYKSSRDVKRHILSVHDKKRHKCPICQKEYIDEVYFNQHMRGHDEKTYFVCSECDQRFKTRNLLRKHRKLEHLKSLKCSHCSKYFYNMTDLAVHERGHTGEKPYHCYFCEKSFKTKHKMKMHIAIHTGETPFQCKVCSKGFSLNLRLKKHEMIHRDEDNRQFNCSYKQCDKNYRTKYQLDTHVKRIHLQLKRFFCSFCPTGFHTKTELNRHIYRHTGEKHFKCSKCSQSYKHDKYLKAHFQKCQISLTRS